MDKAKILNALECCTEFLCEECPYEKYDVQGHPLRCINRLINDLYELHKKTDVHGRWIPTYHTYYNRDGACEIADEWHCSECNFFVRDRFNYCPNCGVPKDGEENG